MSSDAPRRIINSRERGKSSDINRITDLSDRNLQTAVAYLASTDTPESGVFYGFTVSISAGDAIVSAGFGLLNDGLKAYPDSAYRWVELTSALPGLTLTTATTNRWIAIELTPGTTVTVNTTVDVFDPTTGSFIPTSLDKEVQSGPTVSENVGTVDDEFPVPTAGTIPLAYVYVDGGGSVGTGTANVVHCRPLLFPKSPMEMSETHYPSSGTAAYNKTWVQGGGVHVDADGQIVSADACTGKFWDHRIPFFVRQDADFDLTSASAWANNDKASDESAYLYAIPPPYASGYGAIAKREFVVGSAVQANFSGFTTSAASNQANCLVVASRFPPSPGVLGHSGGATSTKTVHSTPFLVSASPPSVNTDEWIYLGAMDWDATPEAQAQKFILGESRVVLQSRFPTTDVIADQPTADTDLAVNLRDGSSTGGLTEGIVPAHATSMRCIVNTDNSSSTLDVAVRIEDDEVVTTVARKTLPVIEASVGYEQEWPVDLIQDVGGTINVRYSGSSVVEFDIITISYIDPIIAAR